MNTRTTFSFFLLTIFSAWIISLHGIGFERHKPEDKEQGKKTLTIHVTTETDGKVVQIDTTIVTTGDFDTDAFLKEKGVLPEEKEGKTVKKEVYIIHPESKDINGSESDRNSRDTMIINNSRVIILSDKFEEPLSHPHPGMKVHPDNMPPCFAPMQGPPFEHMIEGMVRSMGLENMMPFGKLDNIVVKKKRNGKKVIITFEDRREACCEHSKKNKQEEKVIIYKNDEQGMAPPNEEKYIIKNVSGETIVIDKNVETKGNEKIVTVKTDVDKSAPANQETKIVIIKQEDIK